MIAHAVPVGSRARFALALAVALAAAGPAAAQGVDAWPLELRSRGATLVVHPPQVESWNDNRLALRAAVAVRPAGDGEHFGVVWASARTRVDRATRTVALEEIELTRAEFPSAADRGAAYLGTLRARFDGARRTIALDRLEASLAAARADPPSGTAVRNDPPAIVVSERPAVLVRVDGDPSFRAVGDGSFERLINTRALMLRRVTMGSEPGWIYLRVGAGWLFAEALDGDWRRPADPPAGLDAAAAGIVRNARVDTLAGGDAAAPPAIYVTTNPTELIVFRGAPAFAPIAGTGLSRATNTDADVIRGAEGSIYALLAGRWFRAPGMTGPWVYVASADLPAEFRRIPVDSPAGVVLASVAGTPQAREAAIANMIAQTATVPRVGGPEFTPIFDGAPQLRPIEGTTLQSVINSPTPILRAEDGHFYALRAGVWFTAPALDGAWFVAPAVPAAVYAIPPTSPLHFVTYVRIHGSNAKEVRTGYTPGYLGTVLNREGVVVYGTGYSFPSWTGAAWYPAPPTWGVAAQPVHNPATGWSYGFATGVAAAGLPAGAAFHPLGPGSARCCGSTAANVYTAYGYGGRPPARASAAATTTRATPAFTGRYVAPPPARPEQLDLTSGAMLYASPDGQVHRRASDAWQVQTPQGWQKASGDTTALDQERQARAAAEAKAGSWSVGASGGNAGFADRLGAGSGWDDTAGLGGGGWGDRMDPGGSQLSFRF